MGRQRSFVRDGGPRGRGRERRDLRHNTPSAASYSALVMAFPPQNEPVKNTVSKPMRRDHLIANATGSYYRPVSWLRVDRCAVRGWRS